MLFKAHPTMLTFALSLKEKGQGQAYYRRATYLSANRADYKHVSVHTLSSSDLVIVNSKFGFRSAFERWFIFILPVD